jgi:hypothetical protein
MSEDAFQTQEDREIADKLASLDRQAHQGAHFRGLDTPSGGPTFHEVPGRTNKRLKK